MSGRKRLLAVLREIDRCRAPKGWGHLLGTSNQGRTDPEVYAKGSHIFTTHTLSSAMIEEWIRRARRKAPAVRIDWHYVGGRAVILALGDIEQARQALLATRAIHDDMFRRVMLPDWPADTTEAIIIGLWSGLTGVQP